MEQKSDMKKKIVATVILVALFSAATFFIAQSMLSNSSISQNEKEKVSAQKNAEESKGSKDEVDGVERVCVSGPTFSAKMLIVKDPSRVKVGSIYPWKSKGVELDELVKMSDAIGGINGGLYYQPRNSGGHPEGVSVSSGELQYNQPYVHGLHLVGMDNNNKLRIIDLTGKKAADVEKLVKEEGIRDAVTFPEENKAESNWFVPIIVDGKERVVKNALNCCINPRTVIAQRADGAVMLMAVTGRGTSAHFGATALDLLKVMKEHGAVNAANLDGGSSTCMYFNGKYEQTSTTFYYAKGSWNLPNAIVIAKK